jgi:acetyl esterase/lipase
VSIGSSDDFSAAPGHDVGLDSPVPLLGKEFLEPPREAVKLLSRELGNGVLKFFYAHNIAAYRNVFGDGKGASGAGQGAARILGMIDDEAGLKSHPLARGVVGDQVAKTQALKQGVHMTRCIRSGLWAVLFFSMVAGSHGEDAREPILLWPKGAPGEKGDIGAEKRIVPARAEDRDGTTWLTNVTQPTITVYRPSSATPTGTAVLVCPGGGYRILAYDKEGTEIAQWLNSLGVTAVVLKYRVPPRQERTRDEPPLQDAQRALGIIRSHAQEWKIDPARIGVIGFSAGGHLAAHLSTNHNRRSYEPVDAADRAPCRPDFAMLIYPAALVVYGQLHQLAPELKVTADTPPTFLVHSEDDRFPIENSLFYYLALTDARVSAEMHLYPSGAHGYGLRPSSHLASTWPKRAEEWMRSLGLLVSKP